MSVPVTDALADLELLDAEGEVLFRHRNERAGDHGELGQALAAAAG